MLEQTKKYAPIAVRYSVGLAFFLIGIDQLIRPAAWLGYYPDWITSFMSLTSFGIFNGIFDAVIGAFLLIGLLTRIASAIAVFHLVGVIYTLGYNDVAIRDLSILIAAVAIFMYGPDDWALDKKIWKN